jgi:hypothetical protein
MSSLVTGPVVASMIVVVVPLSSSILPTSPGIFSAPTITSITLAIESTIAAIHGLSEMLPSLNFNLFQKRKDGTTSIDILAELN